MALDVPKVFESEYKLACIVWEKEPISTHDLVALCAQKLGWKRTTTYTQLKRLTERGILENKNSVVTAIVPKEAVQIPQSKALSKEDVEEIQRLIDAYKEES